MKHVLKLAECHVSAEQRKNDIQNFISDHIVLISCVAICVHTLNNDAFERTLMLF